MTMEKGNEQQMMDEEYGREFGGCLWALLVCIIAIAGIGCVMMFT